MTFSMRITVSLNDELVPQVKTFAESRGLSIGQAVSELVRKGLRAPLETRIVNGFHVVELPAGSPLVTDASVERLKR
jgi:hypothetical protein